MLSAWPAEMWSKPMCLRITAPFFDSTSPLSLVRVPRPRLRLFDQQLVQQLRHGMVHELAAVVGVKAEYAERKLRQHAFQHWFQPCFGDVRCGSDDLPLRDFID